MSKTENSTCCFLGHRKIALTQELEKKLYAIIEALITQEHICVFLFGSKSQFNALCLETVTALKEKYPHIKRVYVRAEFPYIPEDYRAFLLESYDDTYFPERLLNAGRAVYVQRNREMIDRCRICVFYYEPDYLPPRRKASRRAISDYQPNSGTKLAYDYALQQKKQILLLP